ncbi:hypothetical protein CMV_027571 [Castanea mollissima]|uniref:Uncharacterized protein n=1 Tax=Castanea mollissima TaxID=60419 RepID=A0A8J4QBI2_9ROSI|nr:hypothetical protein CMV_027571 [Castanea mollissima]
MSSVKRDTIGLHFVNNGSTFCSLPDPNAKNIPCFSDVLLQKSIPLFPFWCLDQLQHLRRRRKVKKQLLQRTISMLRSSRCYTSTAKKLFPTTKNFLAV